MDELDGPAAQIVSPLLQFLQPQRIELVIGGGFKAFEQVMCKLQEMISLVGTRAARKERFHMVDGLLNAGVRARLHSSQSSEIERQLVRCAIGICVCEVQEASNVVHGRLVAECVGQLRPRSERRKERLDDFIE